MSSDVPTEMHCALDTKIKVRPGATITLSEELHVPSGTYTIYIEHQRKESSLRKSQSSIAASGELLVTTGKDLGQVLKSEIDFHREHPFLREIHVPEPALEDGADDKVPSIKVLLTVVSTAHIKKTRLRFKLLTKNENVQAQVLSSNTTEKRKNGRVRTISSSASPDLFASSGRSTPSSSYSDLPSIGVSTNLDVSSVLSMSSQSMRDEEEIDPPRNEKLSNSDILEKDTVVIKKSTTFNSEGVEQSTRVVVEHTKTVSETAEGISEKRTSIGMEKSDMDSTSLYSGSSSSSGSSFDPSEENLVYYKEIRLRKKHVHTEKIPIQQKGKYYLIIENSDKSPITRHFSCHATLSQGTTLLKESYTNDAKKKLSDDFTVEPETADLTLEIVHTNSSFGKSELQISLYMKNNNNEEPTATKAVHSHFRTGEVVWSVNACEVDKKHPQKFIAKIPTSGKYYIVVEKLDKMYGGLREIAVDATLSEPPREGSGEAGRVSKVASAVVGGVKARPMKWKSPIFVAPAGSTVDFYVASYAIVGSIVYSLRLRKVPGLTAEEEKTRRMVLLFLSTFGIYYLLYMVVSLLHFIQNIGFTLNILFLSVDITIGRLCFILCAAWFRTNQEILLPCLKDVMETVRKILRKVKHFQNMSDGGKFNILRIFKQMSREGRMNDLRKWERQKLLTANE